MVFTRDLSVLGKDPGGNAALNTSLAAGAAEAAPPTPYSTKAATNICFSTGAFTGA